MAYRQFDELMEYAERFDGGSGDVSGPLALFHGYAERAENGDLDALPHLRRSMREDFPEVVSLLGDHSAQIQQTAIEALSDGTLEREAMISHAEILQRQLAGAGSSPLEQLIARRVYLCSLQLTTCEQQYWDAENERRPDPKKLEFVQRRLERAQNGYLKACRTLAQIKRLQQPMVTVNMAEKQVNLIGGSTGV